MTRALPQFGVVPARKKDAAALARLNAESLETGWSEADFAHFVTDPACIALTARASSSEARILGFVLARTVAGEAEILTLAVAPDMRCQGVARRILEELCARLKARGTTSLFLEVADDNHAASAFYRRLGFRRTGRRKGYYRPSRSAGARDASILQLDLKTAGED